MAPLPRDASDEPARDWGAALGGVETAKMACDTLRALIADAVFLDEEAYTNATTLQRYQQRLQVCARACVCVVSLLCVSAEAPPRHAWQQLMSRRHP